MTLPLDDGTEHLLVRLLQAGPVGIAGYGLFGAEAGVAINAVVALGITFVLSASVVAGAGYAVVVAVDRASDRTTLPPEFRFVVLVFVMAIGVLWEIIEFGAELLASAVGAKVLVQYGLGDIVNDLVFNLVGGLVVAGWDAARPERAADEATEALE